jgi:hypothetical protein
MPKAKHKLARLKQIEAWLRAHFATPYPVKVLYMKKDIIDIHDQCKMDGATHLLNNELIIELDIRVPERFVIDMMIHEWAHAMDWRTTRLEKTREEQKLVHPPEWGVALAAIYTEYYDNKGYEDAEV